MQLGYNDPIVKTYDEVSRQGRSEFGILVEELYHPAGKARMHILVNSKPNI